MALDVGALAPLFAAIGVFMTVFSKKPKVGYYGSCIAGLGILFIGMNMMSDSMMPLKDWPLFAEMITHFSNPLIGILGRCRIYCPYSILWSIGRYFASSCDDRCNRTKRCSLCIIRTKYRYLYNLYHGIIGTSRELSKQRFYI